MHFAQTVTKSSFSYYQTKESIFSQRIYDEKRKLYSTKKKILFHRILFLVTRYVIAKQQSYITSPFSKILHGFCIHYFALVLLFPYRCWKSKYEKNELEHKKKRENYYLIVERWWMLPLKEYRNTASPLIISCNRTPKLQTVYLLTCYLLACVMFHFLN